MNTQTTSVSSGNATTNTTLQPLKSYEKLHDLTGQVVGKYRLLEGHPKQYRFDAKEGQFNINGLDKIGRTLTFQPIAWRIFSDNILNMGTKNWAEIFFIDEKNCVSVILFHGYSVDNIFRLIEPLYYDDLTLGDVLITVIAEKKENKQVGGSYYIATFSYKIADPQKTRELQEFAQDHKIYRQETLTDIANIKTQMNYFNPFINGSAADAGFLPPAGVDQETGEVQ